MNREMRWCQIAGNASMDTYKTLLRFCDGSDPFSKRRSLFSRIVDDRNMKGQLIFTTHDAGLLDGQVFRNDEIWFAEKDRETQSTHLYTLDEFKPRADLDLEKGYLNGRFGAIPFLARFNELNWE